MAEAAQACPAESGPARHKFGGGATNCGSMEGSPRMGHFGETELSHLAQVTVLEHGEDAPSFAHRRAAERLRKLDLDGAHHWCVVSRRAQVILSRMSFARH
jgi:hypothetical protein